MWSIRRAQFVIPNRCQLAGERLAKPGVRAVRVELPSSRSFETYERAMAAVLSPPLPDDTDIYWARSRVLEYLSKIQPLLPEGVRTEIGPDATGVGWVFQYVLEDTSGTHSLADLRAYQDWTLRYYLKSVPGVAALGALPVTVKGTVIR